MKAILSNRIYMTVDEDLYRSLQKKLTHVIPVPNSPTDELYEICNLKIVNTLRDGKKLVAFPIGRTELIPAKYEIVDKRVLNPIENFPEFKPTLRPSQAEIVEDISDNCIVNAKVGWGKSFCGLAIAGRLKLKTLIVVHTVGLRDQWVKEIEKTYGFKPGIIGSGKMNLDAPIVVGNVQTIVKHISKFNREFGLVILDEMHHVPSTTFSQVVEGMFSRYKVGLSGTILRKDMKHVMFSDYFGHKVYKPPVENTMKPRVDVIESGLELPDCASWAERVTTLKESPLYQNLIVALADSYTSQGHKVLIVSDRIEFLKHCSDNSKHMSELLLGETRDREQVIDLVLEGVVNQLYATQSLISEGISINPLSCLILATPINNEPLLEQLIGRIMRQFPGKLPPVVVDVKLTGYTSMRQFNTRMGHYMRNDYSVNFLK